ncbi:MAG TPA: radical SAM protein [Patescibacteria group bacterium]|nr:radical SAM protein [Patescibacteria group bacterium]
MHNGTIELGLSLNNHCNFHCRMCNIWRQDKGENRLDLGKCLQIIDELEAFQVKGVRLSGGDPLLTPWALPLARHISQKGYHTVATTNGSMIDEAFADKIIASGISNLNLSLDARDAKVHDEIRGFAGSHERIIKAIGYLAKATPGVKLGINTVISNLNLHEIVPLADEVERDGRIDHIYFMAVMQPFGTHPDAAWFLREEFRFLWPQDISGLRSVLDRLIELKKKGHKINNSIAQLKVFLDYFSDPLHFTKKATCNLGQEAVEVNQAGDVYLCYFYEPIGNVFRDSLCGIWGSQRAADVREKIRNCRQNCNLLVNCYFEDDRV